VIARIGAVTRRSISQQPTPPQLFQMGDLEVLPAELRAKRGDEVIELSLRDVKILELLHSRPGQPVDRRDIFKHAWGEKYLPNSRTLYQHVSQLRKRVEVDPRHPMLIQTVHGVGYRFESES
jgi:DNA-binding response OmpR family regulator